MIYLRKTKFLKPHIYRRDGMWEVKLHGWVVGRGVDFSAIKMYWVVKASATARNGLPPK